jgi:YYY domain-containing protein
MTSRLFPPLDPWLAGEPVSYYYFGYLMMGNLTELTFIPSRISYNLALAVISAMAGAAAFGLVYNLVRAHGASAFRGVAFALLAPVLLLVASNMEGILEFVRLRGWGGVPFWDWLGIKDLGSAEALSWRPTDYLWWWRGTRVIDSLGPQGNSLDYTITEFPYFSFLLGDLHPHVMSIPFILLFLSFSFNFFLSPTLVGARWVRDHPMTVVAAALLLGALAFINIWDVVPFGLLWAVLLVFKAVRQDQGAWSRVILMVWIPIMATLSLSVLMYLPYYFSADSQVSGILPVGEVATRPVHFLVIWGLFLVILLPLLLRQLPQVLSFWGARAHAACPGCGTDNPAEAHFCGDCGLALGAGEFWPRASIVLGLIFVPFFIWMAWQLGWSTLTWSSTPLVVVVERFLNILPLVLLLFVALYSLIRYGESRAPSAMAFVLALISLALLLVLGPEFLRVDDVFHNRMNTIFKVYYQAWVLLAIASAFGLYFVSSARRPSREVYRLAMGVWWGLVGVLFVGSLYYSVEAAFTKSGQFSGETTLDGLAYIARTSPEEYAAIRWLQDNGKEGEGVLEATGQEWNPAYSRTSGSTGLPTVLGWPGHERQWRSNTKPLDGRAEDIEEIYSTRDSSRAVELLRKYDIQYVVLGPQERASYRDMERAKFSEIGDVVFPGKDVTIYRVRE